MSDLNDTDLATVALKEAKDAVGGASGLAHALNNEISPQAISQWKRVPAQRAASVERVTGIPRHRLRPDIFRGPDEQGYVA
jgi:DNA-binding transcriptional regulator YdaS (Cro superfamily)